MNTILKDQVKAVMLLGHIGRNKAIMRYDLLDAL